MTIKEIAKMADVSISTVSKIVNNKADNINIETRNRVLKLVKEYNYTPYAALKNISGAKTFILGLLLRSASETAFMINGFINTAQEQGYSVLVYDSHGDPDTELRHITSLCKNKVDGVLWELVDHESQQHEHYLKEQNITLSYINNPNDPLSSHIDFVNMGYFITQKLIDRKHTNIACLMKADSQRSNLVFDGFKKCLYDNQITISDDMQLFIQDPGYASKILSQKMTGVVTTHFALALKFYEQMSKSHYYIPSDVSLVSLRDDIRETVSFPPISSIKIPYFEFGQYLCGNLIAQCENRFEYGDENFFSSRLNLDHEESIDLPSTLKTKKVIVLGSINIDVTLNVDELPQSGKTITARSYSTSLGGKGSNQAIGVAKLGCEVYLLGKIGNDYDVSLIFETLKRENVFTQGICRDTKSITGKAYIHVQQDAESSITIMPGANQYLKPQDISSKERLFGNAGYCLIATEVPMETVAETLELARSYNIKVILKPASIKHISDSLLEKIDIFIPNRNEASVLCPHEASVEKQAEYFIKKGIPIVIITLGHKGCYLCTADGTSLYFPAAEFISTDSTGGADAFIAALAAYLIGGYALETSVRIATYAAGFCVSRQGVVPALIDRNSLENHINKFEPQLLLRDL